MSSIFFSFASCTYSPVFFYILFFPLVHMQSTFFHCWVLLSCISIFCTSQILWIWSLTYLFFDCYWSQLKWANEDREFISNSLTSGCSQLLPTLAWLITWKIVLEIFTRYCRLYRYFICFMTGRTFDSIVFFHFSGPTKAASKEMERIEQIFYAYADTSSGMIEWV